MARFFSSIGLFRGAEANAFGSSFVSNGEVTVTRATRLANQTEMYPSPRPVTLSRPASSTEATASSVLANLAQCVTSSTRPSEYVACTRTCWVWPGARRTAVG